jgi:NAD kinase
LLVLSEEPAAVGSEPHLIHQAYNKIKTITDADLSALDFIITFGGDGLLLHCNALFGDRRIPPICCFDFGSLGFLAPFRYREFNDEVS